MTSAREKILAEIQSEKTLSNVLLNYTVKGIEYKNKKDQFIQVLNSIGGKSLEISKDVDVDDFISERIASGKRVLKIQENENMNYSTKRMYSMDVVVIQGGVAVAENGAIWVEEKKMGNRLLPFVCEELVVVIKEKSIVHNMHQAYDLID
jgi:L-lactate dehydrogenase complex protein LldG